KAREAWGDACRALIPRAGARAVPLKGDLEPMWRRRAWMCLPACNGGDLPDHAHPVVRRLLDAIRVGIDVLAACFGILCIEFLADLYRSVSHPRLQLGHAGRL